MAENQFERLGNFILLEKLNSGGMAEVYLAKSIGANGVNKFVGIKRILPQFADDASYIDMFKTEANIAVNLQHSNVVSIIDFKASKNMLYLVMEYVQGTNLRQLLQQKKKKGLDLSLPFIVYIIKEIAAGLDHAHKCVNKTSGLPLLIIHRDMSPQNVMISYDGEIKIVDFGIAKTESKGEATKVGTLKGKFSYMSPEQAGDIPLDQTTDIFSLGIILWELLADDRLFVANNDLTILKRVKECDIPDIRRILPTIPQELEKIVKKALTKDRSVRYQHANELHKDLQRFLNKEYPDFTTSDFATFMRFLFEEDYKKNSEKLVRYGKVQVDIPPPIPHSLREPGQTRSVQITNLPQNSHSQGRIPTNPPAIPSFNSNLALKMEPSTSPESDAEIYPPPTPLELINEQNTRARSNLSPPLFREAFTQNAGINTRTGISISLPGYGQTSRRAKAKKSQTNYSFLISFLLVLGIVLIASFGWVKRGVILEKWGSTRKGDPVSLLDPTNAPIPTNLFSITLRTSPPTRARIYLDDVDTQKFTPAVISVAPDTQFKITLMADGFLPASKLLIAKKDGSNFEMALQTVLVGFVNINVLNGGAKTEVWVNDLKLSEQPPINRYPVPAGAQITIRAKNEFNNMQSCRIVSVDRDQKKNVDLTLSNANTCIHAN